MSSLIVTIDPGQSSGIAIWDMEKWKVKCAPVRTELWRLRKPHSEATWDLRCRLHGQRLRILLREEHIREVYCELPCFFESAGGLMVASQNDLVKLAFLVGIYGGIAAAEMVPFFPVAVADWKGQLPKKICNERIVRTLGSEACAGFKADVWDAVGIGLYVKGFF